MAAKIIWELAETRVKRQQDSRCEVFHLVGPRTVTWGSLLPAIHRHFAAQVVTFPKWVESLSKFETSDSEVEEKPALKLLDFFKSLTSLLEWKQPPWETKRAEEASETLRDLPAIDEKMMDLYLDQWGL